MSAQPTEAPASTNGANGSSATAPRPPVPDTLRMRKGLPPGPSLPPPLQMLRFWYRRIPFLEECRARYGHTSTLRMRLPRSTPFVVLSRPEDLKALYQGPADTMYAGDGSRELMKYFGPTGLAFLEEDDHLTRRKLVNKSLHGDAIERITATVKRIAAEEIATWPRDEVVALYPRVFRMTLDVMRHVSFGDEPDPRLEKVVALLDEQMKWNHQVMCMTELEALSPPVIRALRALRPLGYDRFFVLREQIDALIYEVVEERRRAGGGRTDDLVGLMLASTGEDGRPFTTEQIRDEIMTNFEAGTETTASAISWGVERLSRLDAVRHRLVEEIDAGETAYLTATFQEILRRKPPLPGAIPRHLQKPVDIGGWHYPAGVRLWATPYLVHTNPEIYPDPYAFRPERFLDESPGTYTWIPFGGGRRRCLGHRIAELEITNALREVLTQCDLRPDRPEGEPSASHIVAVFPGRGARVRLVDR